MANGFFLGGFLNREPSTFIELKQNGSINIVANGGINITGNVTVNGDVTANGISLINHVHSGVEAGGSNTGKPQ
jgi:phage baseplate assembly protein gpV